MKRFYCTTCNHMKRQQNWPRDIKYQSSELPHDRKGTCSSHNEATKPVRQLTIKKA